MPVEDRVMDTKNRKEKQYRIAAVVQKTAEILYEDNDLILYYKPAGLAVQSASVRQTDLESIARKHLMNAGKGTSYLGIIHRLDQPVEGIVVFAKNEKAAAELSAQVQDDRMKKQYLALVENVPEKEEGELIHYLTKDSRENRAAVVSEAREPAGTGKKGKRNGNEGKAKKARLFYRILDKTETKALLIVNLYTGRFHQIRAQLSAAGWPVWRDIKYGSLPLTESERNRIEKPQGIALCAFHLELIHPVTKVRIICELTDVEERFRKELHTTM